MKKIIYKVIGDLYAYLFGRNIFRKFNELMCIVSLRSMGILNYEEGYLNGEKKWLEKYLHNKKTPVVIDVGANVGDYSLAVLNVNGKSKIIAFEPHPGTYKTLKNNVKNDNFKSYNLAVGKDEGKIKLYDYDENDGSQHASVYKDAITDFHKSDVISHDVEMIALDSFLETENVVKIDLLKIDVEGNELNVLKGIENYLKNDMINAIQFEFNALNIMSKTTFKDFWALLPNYKIYRILPGGKLLEIEEYSTIFCEIYAFQNIVAILKK